MRFLKSGLAPIKRTYTLLPTSRLNIAPAGDPDLATLGAGVPIHRLLEDDRLEVEHLDVGAEHAGGEVWAAGTGTVGTPIPPP